VELDTQRFVRKPLFVEAVRLTLENFDEVAKWCQGEINRDPTSDNPMETSYIRVRVHNPMNARQTKLFIGDWLLYTERGYKVYTNNAFRKSFEQVGAEVH
jgi:hypothetical protein